MLLHSPSKRPPLKEFGIQIPSSPDKGLRVLNALKQHPVLGPRESEWHIERDDSSINRDDVVRVHSEEYVSRLYSDEIEQILTDVFELVDAEGKPHRYDPAAAIRPLREMFDGTLHGVGGTYQCCKEAIKHGFCFYLGGGAHHAHRDFGHGFCVVNDSAIALRKMQFENRIRTAWVIDVDVHKGDGTAALMQGDSSIITLSVHMARGWPLDKRMYDEKGVLHPSFLPSDIDVPIEEGEEELYVPKLKAALSKLADGPVPDLALVLYGADPYEKDELPSTQKIKLSLEQMNSRDMLIYNFLTDLKVPKAYLMAGGYGIHAWEPYVPFLTETLVEELKTRDG